MPAHATEQICFLQVCNGSGPPTKKGVDETLFNEEFSCAPVSLLAETTFRREPWRSDRRRCSTVLRTPLDRTETLRSSPCRSSSSASSMFRRETWRSDRQQNLHNILQFNRSACHFLSDIECK